MPTLVVTKSYSDGAVLTEDMLDDITDSIETFVNITKLDDQNLQDAAITSDKLATSAVTTVKIDNDAVTTSKIANDAVTAAKMANVDAPFVGEIRMMHTFNTTLSLPRGWMKCNADVVNQVNYDALHGGGAYTTDGIAASPLLNKNLPSALSKYPVGVSTTAQTGASAITYVGNASNQVNLSHDHTVEFHNHLWYDETGTNVADNSFDINGATIPIAQDSDAGGAGDYGIQVVQKDNVALHLGQNFYTNNANPDTNTNLSTTQSIQPHSFEVIYLIKVI